MRANNRGTSRWRIEKNRKGCGPESTTKRLTTAVAPEPLKGYREFDDPKKETKWGLLESVSFEGISDRSPWAQETVAGRVPEACHWRKGLKEGKRKKKKEIENIKKKTVSPVDRFKEAEGGVSTPLGG